MKRTIIIMVLWSICTVFLAMTIHLNPVFANDNHVITDLCDSKVEVPINPEGIACMHCVSPEKIMTLGKGNLIRIMPEQSPWAYKLFPEIKS